MVCELGSLSIRSLEDSLIHRHDLELRLLNLILLIYVPKWGIHYVTWLSFVVLETASRSWHWDSTLILFLYYVRTGRQLNKCLGCRWLRSLIELICTITFLRPITLNCWRSFWIRQIPHKSMRCRSSWMLFILLFFDSKTYLDGSTIRATLWWT